MKRGTGPEICSSCRKMKLPHLGEYKAAFRYNTWRFTCHECLGKHKVHRLTRRNNETPPEREARMWLQASKIQASAEFKLGPFIYDFAVPKICLLIELDSRRYHTSARHRTRDSYKDKNATDHGWTVKRIQIGPHMLLDLERCLHEQASASL
jgi:very-short-patch-repair endonuclease